MECGELARAILKNDIQNQKEEIGDIFVVATIMEGQLECNFYWDFHVKYKRSNAFFISLIVDNTRNNINLLHNICENLNLNLDECVEIAWNKIKERKGVTKNGTFIKD